MSRAMSPTKSVTLTLGSAAAVITLLLLLRGGAPSQSVKRVAVFENSAPPTTLQPLATSPPPPPPNPAEAPPPTQNPADEPDAAAADRPCRFEFPPLLPLLNGSTDDNAFRRAAAGPFAGVRRLALPPAPSECAAYIPGGRVVARSEVHPRRFLVAFPAGGEVFALGVPGRMPLRSLSLELSPADDTPDSKGSPWMLLRHAPSATMLYMVSPKAAEGAWMLTLVPRSKATGRGELFCSNPNHGLYSHAAQGYVNLRGEVLVRGHD